ASKESGAQEEQSTDESASKSTATLDNIGMTVRNLTEAEKEKYHVTNGVIVAAVAPASEAADRFIPRNSVITEAGRQKVKNASDFERIINANKGKAVGMMITDQNGDSHFYAVKVPNE